jgi:hypothetical protein
LVRIFSNRSPRKCPYLFLNSPQLAAFKSGEIESGKAQTLSEISL